MRMIGLNEQTTRKGRSFQSGSDHLSFKGGIMADIYLTGKEDLVTAFHEFGQVLFVRKNRYQKTS